MGRDSCSIGGTGWSIDLQTALYCAVLVNKEEFLFFKSTSMFLAVSKF